MWKLINPEWQEIAKEYQVGPLVAKLLAASDLSAQQRQELLNPDLHLTTSKAECIQACCSRIMEAKHKNEKVFIGGDYDADGICATAILKDTLDRLGIQNGYYIPDRFKEGYGLSKETVEQVVQKGYQLIITVDNGVKAKEAIEKAKECNIDLIITDHHRIEEPVDVPIVVHPDYMEERYEGLCGAGVALQISRALLGDVKAHIVLASVASVADVMPLWKETRSIVQLGFQYLAQNEVPALSHLIQNGKEINEKTIGFEIAPRLNSVGRMNDISNVNTLVPFLLSRNEEQITSYVTQLNLVNTRRKELSQTMYQEAIKKIRNESFLILEDASFHEGICGLVAGRICDEFGKPTLVLAEKEELIKGSGRSVKGFDLYQFFAEGFEELTSFGGHEQAVGLSLPKEQLDSFMMKIQRKMENVTIQKQEEMDTAILIGEEDITFDAINELRLLRPFPKELHKAIFGIKPSAIKEVLHTPKVTKYEMGSKETTYEGVLFPYRKVEIPEQIHLVVGEVSLNRFRDRITPQIDIAYIE